ncbi:MAG: hypothetical protein J6P93_02225, partial [Alphaproteobacteria bacterium]|nr:hypothetical protein [Alphaproteobacteria bacterium]
MQSKNISLNFMLIVSLFASVAMAQDVKSEEQKAPAEPAKLDVLSDFSGNVETNKKKAVNFPARSSLDTLELA